MLWFIQSSPVSLFHRGAGGPGTLNQWNYMTHTANQWEAFNGTKVEQAWCFVLFKGITFFVMEHISLALCFKMSYD